MMVDWEAIRADLHARIDHAAAVAQLAHRLDVASVRRSLGQRFRWLAA